MFPFSTLSLSRHTRSFVQHNIKRELVKSSVSAVAAAFSCRPESLITFARRLNSRG